MQINQQFLRRVSFAIPIALVALLLASPTGALAGNPYPFQVVPPNYVATGEAGTVLTFTPTSSYPAADDGVSTVPLPFTFNFYGQGYTTAYVSTNGYINFLAPNSYYDNVCPLGVGVRGAIYVFWDDLDTSSGSVRTQLLGEAPNRQFIIEWSNVGFYGDSIRRFSFEIVLSESGTITLQYGAINYDFRERGGSATIGLDSPTGEMAVQFSCDTQSIGTGEFAIRFGQVAIPVAVDIKPGGCPNPFNVGSKGVLPVAILGTRDFEVSSINPNTVNLAGPAGVVRPLRWSLENVGTPNQCNFGPDGYLDMTFKFDSEAISAALGTVNDGEVRVLQLSGKLLDGTDISGEDVVKIIKKGK